MERNKSGEYVAVREIIFGPEDGSGMDYSSEQRRRVGPPLTLQGTYAVPLVADDSAGFEALVSVRLQGGTHDGEECLVPASRVSARSTFRIRINLGSITPGYAGGDRYKSEQYKIGKPTTDDGLPVGEFVPRAVNAAGAGVS
jgi:hypothetical protein